MMLRFTMILSGRYQNLNGQCQMTDQYFQYCLPDKFEVNSKVNKEIIIFHRIFQRC